MFMEDHHLQVAPRSPDQKILGHSPCSEGDRPLLHPIPVHPSSTAWQPRPSPPPRAQLLRLDGEQQEDTLYCKTKEHTGTTSLVPGATHMKVHAAFRASLVRTVRSHLQHDGTCSYIPCTASVSSDYSSYHCLLALSHCRTVTSGTAPSERLSFFSFLDDFARTATVDPSAISVTAAHESSPATVHCLSGKTHGTAVDQPRASFQMEKVHVFVHLYSCHQSVQT